MKGLVGLASLIEDLIVTLEEEKDCYSKLLAIGQAKTEIIVSGDVSGLVELTENEQEMASYVVRLDKKREGIIQDIALVTNKDANELTISNLVELLAKQEKEHKQLKVLRDDIKEVVERLKLVNDRNKVLLQESLDYIDFTMNALQSGGSIPNGNYQSQGNIYDSTDGKRFFDAKQ